MPSNTASEPRSSICWPEISNFLVKAEGAVVVVLVVVRDTSYNIHCNIHSIYNNNTQRIDYTTVYKYLAYVILT